MAGTQKIDIKKQFSWIIRLPILAFIVALLAILFIFEFRNSINQEYFNLTNLERSVYSHNKAVTNMHSDLESYIATNENRFLKSYEKTRLEKTNFSEDIKKNKISIPGSLIEKSDAWSKKASETLFSSIEVGDDSISSKPVDLYNSYTAAYADAKKTLSSKKNELQKSSNKLRFFSIAFTISLGFIFAGFIYFVVRRKILFIATHYNQLIYKKEQQREELIAVSKSKDLFLANMSHEIRTPLGAIIGFANLANEDNSLELKTRENIGFVIRNSQHLLGLIEDLFDLTKIGNDKLDLNLEKSDLLQIINDVKNTFIEKTLDSKQILIFKIKGVLPKKIIIDPLRFKQILTNLIGNAIKFTPAGKKITCSFENHEDKLVIDILDEGIGIAADKKDLIYNSFEQVDSEHSRIFGGAGLGLSISKNLTQLLNGQLELVWSQKGKGSHFRLSFPIKSVGSNMFDHSVFLSDKENKNDATKNKDVDLSKALFNKNILVAEDSMENQILFRIFIEGAGANVTLVDNGKKAVDEALKNDYDTVVMDIQMPGMDGYQAIEALRNLNYKGKVIALTAHALKGDRTKALKSGFDGYLSKPVSKKTLITTIFDQL
jgi:signal transduction histidine kinase